MENLTFTWHIKIKRVESKYQVIYLMRLGEWMAEQGQEFKELKHNLKLQRIGKCWVLCPCWYPEGTLCIKEEKKKKCNMSMIMIPWKYLQILFRNNLINFSAQKRWSTSNISNDWPLFFVDLKWRILTFQWMTREGNTKVKKSFKF